MAEKIALQGFSRVKLFPVLRNDASGYEAGEGFDLPWAQELSKEQDVTESKIYADDVLYLNMKSWNGLNSTITMAEMSLAMMAKLGFGEFSETENTLKWNPQGENKQFAVTFRCLRADGKYRMYKMYSFTVNEIKESGVKTRGESGDINTYQLVGTFAGRLLDNMPGEQKDSDGAADLSWLDSVSPASA